MFLFTPQYNIFKDPWINQYHYWFFNLQQQSYHYLTYMLNEEFHWNPPNLDPSLTSYIIAFQKWFGCVKTKMTGSGSIFSGPREDCVSLVTVNFGYWECDSFSKCKGRIKTKVFFFHSQCYMVIFPFFVYKHQTHCISGSSDTNVIIYCWNIWDVIVLM